eukprot:1184353-Prorocentrum_minimum.AAC.1
MEGGSGLAVGGAEAPGRLHLTIPLWHYCTLHSEPEVPQYTGVSSEPAGDTSRAPDPARCSTRSLAPVIPDGTAAGPWAYSPDHTTPPFGEYAPLPWGIVRCDANLALLPLHSGSTCHPACTPRGGLSGAGGAMGTAALTDELKPPPPRPPLRVRSREASLSEQPIQDDYEGLVPELANRRGGRKSVEIKKTPVDIDKMAPDMPEEEVRQCPPHDPLRTPLADPRC